MICKICNKKRAMFKHVLSHGLTLQQYREKYGETRLDDYKNAWKAGNRKKWDAYQRKYTLSAKGRYTQISYRSRQRGFSDIISREDFRVWYQKIHECYYCGIKEGHPYLAGSVLEIERKNNALPYVNDNIAFACKYCNGVKSNILTEQEMLQVGRTIMRHRWEKK